MISWLMGKMENLGATRRTGGGGWAVAGGWEMHRVGGWGGRQNVEKKRKESRKKERRKERKKGKKKVENNLNINRAVSFPPAENFFSSK